MHILNTSIISPGFLSGVFVWNKFLLGFLIYCASHGNILYITESCFYLYANIRSICSCLYVMSQSYVAIVSPPLMEGPQTESELS